MAETTTTLHLTKPALDEYVDLTVLNTNSDLVDAYATTTNNSITSINNSISSIGTAIGTLQSGVQEINGKIPTQATALNQLADKDFVNSSINNVAAYYITKNVEGDAFSTKAELDSTTVFYSGGVERVPTRNDYTIVLEDETKIVESTGLHPTTRYLYNNGWAFQYIVNNTSVTAAQLAAMNSGITASKVALYDTKSTVSVNSTGTSTNTVKYITVDGIESKLSGNEIPTITLTSGQVTEGEEEGTYSIAFTDEQMTIIDSDENSLIKIDCSQVSSFSYISKSLFSKYPVTTGVCILTTTCPADGGMLFNIMCMSEQKYGMAYKVGIQYTLDFDATPTADSENPVKSSGIYTALTNKQDKIPTITVATSQVISANPITIQFTNEQATIINNDNNRFITVDCSALSSDYPATTMSNNKSSNSADRILTNESPHYEDGVVDNYNTYSIIYDIANKTGTVTVLGLQSRLTFDNVPTEDSENPVKSGGIWSKFDSVQDDLDDLYDTKEDVIEDLETIRSGASAGATALQDAPSDNKQYGRKNGSWSEIESTGGTWGTITGTITDQTDLIEKFNTYQKKITISTTAPTSPSFGDIWIDEEDTSMKYVGGKIFYIDSSISGDTYTFYDSNGNVISDIQVGDTPYYYTNSDSSVSGKYYVYNDSNSLVSSKTWTYQSGGSWVYNKLNTSEEIGYGKSNTSIVMAADNGAYVSYPDTIWNYVSSMNSSVKAGCSDWFVASKGEMESLRTATDRSGNPLVSIFNRNIWSSSEMSMFEDSSYYWYNSSQTWLYGKKYNSYSFIAIRSF